CRLDTFASRHERRLVGIRGQISRPRQKLRSASALILERLGRRRCALGGHGFDDAREIAAEWYATRALKRIGDRRDRRRLPVTRGQQIEGLHPLLIEERERERGVVE